MGRVPIANMVTDADRTKLIRAVEAGASNQTCADLIGVSRSGYATLLETDEALRIELGKARAMAIIEVLEAAKERAQGRHRMAITKGQRRGLCQCR